MFGFNGWEVLVIAVIALVVIGPERLPKYAEHLARFVRQGRTMAMGLREQVREEIGPEFDDVDWRKLDPRQYDPRRIVKEALSDTFEDVVPTKKTSATPKAAGAVAASSAKAVTSDGASKDKPDLTKRAAAGDAATPPVAAPFDDDAT